MNRAALLPLPLLALAACVESEPRIEYDPGRCAHSCEAEYRKCTDDTVATTESRQFCRDQRKRCREFCGEE